MRKEPARRDVVKKILKVLQDNPKGIWIRKLARTIKEPVPTVYKYVTREDYVGRLVTTEKLPKESGGHTIIRANYTKSAEIWKILREP